MVRRISCYLCSIPGAGCDDLEVLMQQQRFHVEDRVRTLQPVGWVSRGSYGTVVRVFFGTDTYGVRFDHQISIRIVNGHELERLGVPS
jgi:hypothetical protein